MAALKAYFETRGRYLAGLPPRQTFNQIGEALPTVLVNGRVHGTWAWQPRTRTVTTTLISGRVPRRLAPATAALTDALRAGWRNATSAGRVAPADPNQLSLAI